MKALAKLIKKATEKMAVTAYGSASHWGAYQSKEPKNIMKK